MTLNDVMEVIDLYEKYQVDGRGVWFSVDAIRKAVSQFAAEIEADSWNPPPAKEGA